jgi:plastocyanin
MHARRSLTLGSVICVVLFAAACSSSTPAATAPPPSPQSSPPAASPSPTAGSGTITIGGDLANNHGAEDASGKTSISVDLISFFFDPTVISGTPGQKITLDLENKDTALHNFSLTKQKIDQDVNPNATATVTVKIPASGFVEFFCKYHRARGMAGELTAA